MVCVRFWAGARALSGVRDQQVEAATLGCALDEIRRRFGPDMAQLLERSVLLVDGMQTRPDADREVDAGTLIEVLPPYAGGSR